MTTQEAMDNLLVSDFINDLKGLTDAQLAVEECDTQEKINRETDWVEAVTAEQRIRARAAS